MHIRCTSFPTASTHVLHEKAQLRTSQVAPPLKRPITGLPAIFVISVPQTGATLPEVASKG
jgi:hypothetical protein